MLFSRYEKIDGDTSTGKLVFLINPRRKILWNTYLQGRILLAFYNNCEQVPYSSVRAFITMVEVPWIKVYQWNTKNKIMLFLSLEEKYLNCSITHFYYVRGLIQVKMDSILFVSKKLNMDVIFELSKDRLRYTYM
jgi:hypothetical protein